MVDVDFLPNGDMRMTPFMEGFPFPFYVVVNSLEEVCKCYDATDAVRRVRSTRFTEVH